MTRTDADVAFYTVADANYYPGLVGLINSLRLQGHWQEIIVGDVGLLPAQRRHLEGHCRFLDFTTTASHPYFLKARGSRALNHSGVLVMVDTDVIVTRPLEKVFSMARAGKVCVMLEEDSERWFSEWDALLDLRAPLRHEQYFNAGFVAVSTLEHPGLIERWDELNSQIEVNQADKAQKKGSPFANSDQDALNALMMSEVPSGSAHYFDDDEVPGVYDMRMRVHVTDLLTCACTFRGGSTLFLHWWGKPKPWLSRLGRGIRRDAFILLLRRLHTWDDVAIPCQPKLVPIWLRSGVIGSAAFACNLALGSVRQRIQSLRRHGRHWFNRGR